MAGWKSQPFGWDVLAKRYLKYFCYGSTLKFSILNPAAADAEALFRGTDNIISDWFRIYNSAQTSTNWPLPLDPADPGQVIGAWSAPVARTSKVSFFKSRRTANMTEFGVGADRQNIESLMFEGDTLVDDRLGTPSMTNEELNYSRMAAYSQQLLIPPRKQRQLAGVKTLDLTGTQETRMFGSMAVNSKFLPRHRIKIYKKMRRALTSLASNNRPAATGVGPWRLTVDLDENDAPMPIATPDQQFGCYVIQFDDITQKTTSEWNMVEIAVDIAYKVKFFGDKTKPVDQHQRYLTEFTEEDTEHIITQQIDRKFLHNGFVNTDTTLEDDHTYGSSNYRNFGTAWPGVSGFQDIEAWQRHY